MVQARSKPGTGKKRIDPVKLFEMRLCALLGIPSRHLLREVLTHEDYLDWQWLAKYDPWDRDREDLRAVFLSHAIAAPHMKQGKMPNSRDYLYAYMREAPKQRDVSELKKIVRTLPGKWTHKESQ